jgi:hypothetical protein
MAIDHGGLLGVFLIVAPDRDYIAWRLIKWSKELEVREPP